MGRASESDVVRKNGVDYLDHGGACRGLAFQVAAGEARAVLDYLWQREMVADVYQPRRVPLRLGRRPRVH